MKGFLVGLVITMFLWVCVSQQQSWIGSAQIKMKNGQIAYCPDHFITTPAAVACYTDINKGKNIFLILKSEIESVSIKN